MSELPLKDIFNVEILCRPILFNNKLLWFVSELRDKRVDPTRIESFRPNSPLGEFSLSSARIGVARTKYQIDMTNILNFYQGNAKYFYMTQMTRVF